MNKNKLEGPSAEQTAVWWSPRLPQTARPTAPASCQQPEAGKTIACSLALRPCASQPRGIACKKYLKFSLSKSYGFSPRERYVSELVCCKWNVAHRPLSHRGGRRLRSERCIYSGVSSWALVRLGRGVSQWIVWGLWILVVNPCQGLYWPFKERGWICLNHWFSTGGDFTDLGHICQYLGASLVTTA